MDFYSSLFIFLFSPFPSLLPCPETVHTTQPNKEVATLRKRVQELSDENNMLKFKVEVLLDMVCEGVGKKGKI